MFLLYCDIIIYYSNQNRNIAANTAVSQLDLYLRRP